MSIAHVTNKLDDLESDCRKIATDAKADLVKVVRRNVANGARVTRGIARSASGPHGKLYYKRITSEMTGILSGEYGPTGVVDGNAVGAGWRHGHANTDLEKSQDIIGPQFAHDVQAAVSGWFWPA